MATHDMTAGVEPLLEDAVDIEAPPGRVWELVGDVRRLADWSPQVTHCELLADSAEIGSGARFVNHNLEKSPDGQDLTWTTHSEVVRFVPEREIAFRVEENWAVWSFTLEPGADGGTRLIERRAVPEGISDLARQLTDGFMGGQEIFTQVLRAGMRETLERIKVAAEG